MIGGWLRLARQSTASIPLGGANNEGEMIDGQKAEKTELMGKIVEVGYALGAKTCRARAG